MLDDDCVLEVKNLAVQFTLPRQGLFAEPARVRAVDGVSFSVRRGRTFGIVGESGSGKTTTALSVMRLAPITSGSVILNGKNIESVGGEELRLLRRRMQIVFQDPFSSLNPRMRAGDIVREPMDLLDVGDVSTREERVSELFAAVGLRADQRILFPHQFSGGQRQRICIARALATKPDLIVCDEPVSALDVAVQAQILNLLKRLQESHNFTYLFISHDLGVVQHICHDVAVMYLGRLVEQSSGADLFAKPLHPYTWALMSAVPSARPSDQGKARVRLTGDPPSPINPPAGCGFSPRCPFATEQCRAERPQLRKVSGERLVACHLVDASGDGPHHRLEAV